MEELSGEELGAGVVKRPTRSPTAASSSTSTTPARRSRPSEHSTPATTHPVPTPRRCAGTCSPATGSRSPQRARTAPSCRRPTSIRSRRRRRPTRPRSRALRRRRVREQVALVRAGTASRDGAPAGDDAPRGLDDLARRPRPHPHLGRPLRGRAASAPSTPARSARRPRTRARTVIEAWADRTAALSALPGVEQVFPFENRGEAIGVTLHHPHGQIYAYPYVTPRTDAPAGVDRPRRRPTCSRGSSTRAGPSASCCAASTGPPSCRSRRAGRSRCTCCRTATCPTSPRRPRRARRARTALPATAARDRRALRHPTPYIAAWHQAPVNVRPRHRPASPAADLPATRGRQAEVPRRLRGRDGRLDRRRAPENSAAQLRDAVATTIATDPLLGSGILHVRRVAPPPALDDLGRSTRS